MSVSMRSCITGYACFLFFVSTYGYRKDATEKVVKKWDDATKIGENRQKKEHAVLQHLSVEMLGYSTNVAIYMYTIFHQNSTLFFKRGARMSICISLVKKDQKTEKIGEENQLVCKQEERGSTHSTKNGCIWYARQVNITSSYR